MIEMGARVLIELRERERERGDREREDGRVYIGAPLSFDPTRPFTEASA